MKKSVLSLFSVVSALVCVAGDGTWLSTSQGGDWTSSANWVDGILPDGGVATVNLADQTTSLTISGAGTIPLTELRVQNGSPWDKNQSINFMGMLFDLASPAKITVNTTAITFGPNTLTNETLLTFTGTGRSVLSAPQQLKGKVLVTDNGWIRAVQDTSLGPTPTELVPDAITLDQGMLQNGGDSTIAATRGITVTARGGALTAGYAAPARLTILSPITGAGGIDIAYENSPVVLSNPANDWCGDTRVGTLQCKGLFWGSTFGLTLGADEVIPHGEGKGRVILGPYATTTNTYGNAPLDLAGHTETVNALESSWRGVLRSSTAGGVLKTIADDDMDFRGSIEAGATFEKHGAGTLTFAAATGVLDGGIDVRAGTLAFAASSARSNGRITLAGGSMSIVPARGLSCGNSASTNVLPTLSQRHIYPFYGASSANFNNAGEMSVYRGRWILPESGTYSFAKSYRGLAVLKIDGEILIDDNLLNSFVVKKDVALAAGTHEVELRFARLSSSDAGAGSFLNGIVYDPQNGDFATAEEKARARVFTDDGGPNLLASGYPSKFLGVLDLQADATLTITPDAEPFIMGGRVMTKAETPHTLTVSIPSGAPLVVGSSDAAASAIIDAPLVCASGLVLTNYVTLKQPVPVDAVVAPGATLTRDYAGAFAEDVTLTTTDLRISSEGLGNGTITVPSGRTLIFDTQTLEGGVYIDAATGTRAYANNVVLQGGTLAFNGAGTITYTGAVSGSGRIVKKGSGSVVFSNGTALTSETEIDITAGVFRLTSGTAVGTAVIHVHNGVLANVEGEDIDLPSTVAIIADAGGVQVDGATATMTIRGQMTHRNNISKWGEGTLRIAGTDANYVNVHVRGGTLALAKEGGVAAVNAVIGCNPGCRLVLDADGQFVPSGAVGLDGGVFDLNGHSTTLNAVNTRDAGSVLTNGGASAATITCLSTNTVAFTGTLADGAAKLTFVSGGAGVWDFSNATLANTGFAATNGVLKFAGDTAVKAPLLRFTPSKTRPTTGGANEYENTGAQIGEFGLTLNGEAVTWPEGTTAWAARPAVGNKEAADKAIDGSASTKWYANGNSFTPLFITCPTEVRFDGYRLMTANDAIGRDPVSWTLDVGVVGGGVTNWTQIDQQTDVSNLITTARNTWQPIFSVARALPADALPPNSTLHLAAPGGAEFGWSHQHFTALTGTGTLTLTDGGLCTLQDGCDFSGTISGEGTAHLALGSATIPGIVAASEGVTIVNDGVAGTMSFSDGEVRTAAGVYADGTATLGFSVTDGTTLYLKGAGSTQSGETQVGAGSSVRTGPGVSAQYFRFTSLKGTSGQTRNNIQISELQLRANGAYLPWPAETTATSKGDSSGKNEGAMQVIDGKTSTKCYWSGPTAPLYVTAPAPIYFEGYQWYTANDSMTTRNPVSWQFEYSMDGTTWTLFDEQTDRATVTTTLTLAYVYDLAEGEVVAADAFSDNSKLVLAAAATGSVSHVEETLGALAGAGVLEIRNAGLARLKVTDESSFSGEVVGAGTLVKAGEGTQTLSGAVALNGTLVVEAGTLNLDGATLNGITNIVLKGGVLTGTATVAGDLTVTSDGGTYAANLAVAGRLTLVGTPTLGTGFAGKALRGTAFTCGSVDAASQALYAAALASEDLPRGWKFNVQVSGTKLAWSVTPGGTVIYFK